MAVFTSTLGVHNHTNAGSACTPNTSEFCHLGTFGPVVTFVSATISSGTPPPGMEPFVCPGASSALYMVGVPEVVGTYVYQIDALMSDSSHTFWDVTSHTIQLGAGCPTITITPAPPLPEGMENVGYNGGAGVTFAASAGDSPFTWDLAETSDALPAGLALSSGGVLSGTIDAGTAGTYNLVVRVVDDNGCTGIRVYSLEVVELDPIVVLPATLPDGARGERYEELITATGAGGGPFTFTIEDGALPAGLTLDPDGTLAGLIGVAGSFTFTIRATDEYDNFGEREYTLIVSGLRILIDGEDVTADVATADLELPLNRQATGNLELGDPTVIPARGLDVLVYARDGITPIFGGLGIVRSVGSLVGSQAQANPANKVDLDLVDYSVFFDDADPITIVSEVPQYLEDVIADIVAQSLAVYGITYDAAPTGQTVPPIEWINITVPDAFKRITDATGVVFRVDPLKGLKVFVPLEESAPVTITDANINAFDLSWRDPAGLPKNTVDLTCGPTGNGVTTQRWTADGIATSFEVDIQAVIGNAEPARRANAYLSPVGATNFSDGNTIGAGSSTYTFRTSLVGDVAGEVLIGANVNASLANLNAAINLAGGGVYAPSTPANADVDSYMRAADQLEARALVAGAAGNAIAVTSSHEAIAFWYGEGGIPRGTLQLGADATGAAGWTQGYVLEDPDGAAVARPLSNAPDTSGYYVWTVTDGRGTISVGDGGTLPAADLVLELVYMAVFPFHAIYSTGSPPRTFREAHPEIVNYADGLTLAQQIHARESVERRDLEVFTDVDGFFPGQALTVDTVHRGGFYLEEFLVAAVRIRLVNADLWEYSLTCQETSSYAGSYVEQWKALTSGGGSSAAPATVDGGGATIAGDVYSDGRQSFRADQSMGGHKLTFVDDPVADSDAANKGYVDTVAAATLYDANVYTDGALEAVIHADGSVDFTADQSLAGFALTDVADPTNDQDAATKAYVDANAGGTGGTKGLVLLEERVASASSSLNFTTRNMGSHTGATFQADFDEYVIEILSLLPGTNNVGIQIRVTTDGGSTWAAGASDYRWSYMAYGSGGPGNTFSTGATSIATNGFTNYTNQSSKPLNGSYKIFDPLSTSVFKMLAGHSVYWDLTPTLVTSELVASYQQTTAINGIQLFPTSGTLTSGLARVYGVQKTAAAGGAAEIIAGAFSTRPAAGTDGDLFLPTDGFTLGRDNGTEWQPWGPLSAFTTPSDSGFSWRNQGSSTVTVDKDRILLRGAGTGNAVNIVARVKTAPATPYVVTARFIPPPLSKAYNGYGLVFRQNGAGTGTGRLLAFWWAGHNFAGSVTPTIRIEKWTDETTASASYAEFLCHQPALWLRIADNGTNVIFSISSDGDAWIDLHTVSRTDFLLQGPDQIGFMAFTMNAVTPNFDVPVNLVHWKIT